MTRKPEYNWDEANKKATCTLYLGNKSFTGNAFCHPEDEDMMNRYTGLDIAAIRAEIKLFKYLRQEVENTLKAYIHLYSIMSQSKQFNKESYEAKTLSRKIAQTEQELEDFREIIKFRKKELYLYIEDKQLLYQKLRHKREKVKK